jgi:hypothetical protein
MADGTLVPSMGTWTGNLDWNDVRVRTTFEVFPSGGSWTVLIGKPLLKDLDATHAYGTDTITVPTPSTIVDISNANPTTDPSTVVHTIEDNPTEANSTSSDIGTIPELDLDHPTDIFTRRTAPFNPERVARIHELITVGDDLDDKQKGVL